MCGIDTVRFALPRRAICKCNCRFPNNDVKYDANKQRARLYAQGSGKRITWVQAKDEPSAAALQERPNLTVEKTKMAIIP